MTATSGISRRLTAKEIIDRAHTLVPASRAVDNRRAGRVVSTMIEAQEPGAILDERARFARGEDHDSPVDCAVYEVRADVDVDALALDLGTTLTAHRS